MNDQELPDIDDTEGHSGNVHHLVEPDETAKSGHVTEPDEGDTEGNGAFTKHVNEPDQDDDAEGHKFKGI